MSFRLSFVSLQIKDGSISVCLIDDCQDADVPLAEILFTDICVLHKFQPHSQGKTSFRIIGDYYNRSLSGWEPFLEKWGYIFPEYFIYFTIKHPCNSITVL